MGVALEFVNFTELFEQRMRTNPYIINDLSNTTEVDKNNVNKLIYTKYTTDLLSNLPSCECGELVGEYNVGVKCSKCGTEVRAPLDQDLEPLVWMRSPEGVAPLINPIIWSMLNHKFSKSNFEILRWIADTSFVPQVKKPPVLQQVENAGIPRGGYNYFVQNFDALMRTLFELKAFRGKKNTIDPLFDLIMQHRNCVFSYHLPLPNRSLLVLEDSNMGAYADPIATQAVDAIQSMVNIDSPIENFSVRQKENRTIKTIAQLSVFYEDTYRRTLAKKEGILRKHVFGTRSHFSFRAVISSLTAEHDYDELHIPWGIGVSVLKLHLMNKLIRRGYAPNEAFAFLNEHAQKYHPLLEELFHLLIEECPFKGIPVVFQRNPSLERGSAQAMFVTQVKKDPSIPTVSLSILAVKGFNADFDGDQLNGTLSLDLITAEQLQKLAPHMSTFDLNEPRRVSKNLSMPKPVVSTIANWVHSNHTEIVDPEKAARMAQLPEYTGS